MVKAEGRFEFLSRDGTIQFLRLLIPELQKLTIIDGFSGVRDALSKAMDELERINETPDPNPLAINYAHKGP